MPRFENEGYNPNNRKRNVDRTVPESENYYGKGTVDLNFNNRERIVRDNQKHGGINPCDEFGNAPKPEMRFQSERREEFVTPPTQRRGNPQPTGNKDKPKRKSSVSIKNKIKLIIAAVILVPILIVTGVFGASFNRINYNDKKANQYVDSSTLVADSSVKNILLLGVDARTGENADETRSDTMMLVSVDTAHKCIKLTSFLRDTWVYIPSLDYNQRLNAACSSGGYQGVVDAIEYNFGVDIDGYAVVDFEMFKVLVDSLGGVEVDVTEAEAEEVTSHPYRYGDVKLDAGKYKLSGEQALAYCRIRKIDTDFVRTQRQRTVMSAILSSAKSANPVKLMNMVYKSAPYIETDLSKGEIISIATRAVRCLGNDISQEKVPFEGTWEYATIRGNSVISIDTDANKNMLKEYIYEQ